MSIPTSSSIFTLVLIEQSDIEKALQLCEDKDLDENITSKTKQLTVRGYYNNGEETDITDHLTWESSDTNVATVDENGLVTAKNQGSTEITAKYIDEAENILLQNGAYIYVYVGP